MITVVDVCREMGVEPVPEMMWSVGNLVRDIYVSRRGELPPKELRPKTYADGGSHCFAVYPLDWRQMIMTLISEWGPEQQRQMDLFRD